MSSTTTATLINHSIALVQLKALAALLEPKFVDGEETNDERLSLLRNKEATVVRLGRDKRFTYLATNVTPAFVAIIDLTCGNGEGDGKEREAWLKRRSDAIAVLCNQFVLMGRVARKEISLEHATALAVEEGARKLIYNDMPAGYSTRLAAKLNRNVERTRKGLPPLKDDDVAKEGETLMKMEMGGKETAKKQ